MAISPPPLPLQDRLCTAVQDRRDHLADLLQAMIRIPTLNPPGPFYRDFCELVSARLAPLGFDVELLRAHGSLGDHDSYPRWNLVARREGGHPGECIHFNSHHDVVEVGQGWTRDPFGGERDGDRIYGRGTCDMKGGLATSIIAAEAFLAMVPDFAGAIEISSVADEESGGFAGAAFLAHAGYFSPDRVQHVIIPEPLHKDRICLGHRGVWWAEIETLGRIAHGSMPFLGDSALRHMAALLREIEDQLYPRLTQRQTSMPVIPAGARQSTLNLNSLHGGQPELPEDYSGLPTPCVADRARLTLDRRFLIEESLAAVRGEVVEILERLKATRPGFDYTMRDLFHVLPAMTDRAAPVVQATAWAIEAVFGRPAEYVVSPGTYDQKHVVGIGGLQNCIAYGPGILDLAHQPDEWISVTDMVESAQVMALTMASILGSRT
jgi:succinyl-diaminopimelate desuccinylase